jgi:hypothetical protein
MGQVIDMSAARRERAIRRASEKVRKEEKANQLSSSTTNKLADALDKYGSFSGNQMKKKKE